MKTRGKTTITMTGEDNNDEGVGVDNEHDNAPDNCGNDDNGDKTMVMDDVGDNNKMPDKVNSEDVQTVTSLAMTTNLTVLYQGLKATTGGGLGFREATLQTQRSSEGPRLKET